MFCKPYTTSSLGGKAWWTVVRDTAQLVAQAHRAPGLWWGRPYRVLVQETGVCIAEADSEEGLQRVWSTAVAMADNLQRALRCTRLSPWLLQEALAPYDNNSNSNNNSNVGNVSVVASAVLEAAVAARSWPEAVEALRVAGPEWWGARDSTGLTVLHVACARGRERLARRLLAQGADCNAADAQLWTPLHAACDAGQLTCAAVLLEHRCFVMQGTREGNVALHYLAKHPVDEAWELVAAHICDAGCSVNCANYSGDTPLQRACFRARLDCAAWFIKHGATTQGALHMALRSPNPEEVVDFLLQNGAQVTAENRDALLQLAKEQRISDRVMAKLVPKADADHHDFVLVDSDLVAGPDDPCGICKLPLMTGGPPLGCVACHKIRCARCVAILSGGAICLSCASAATSDDALGPESDAPFNRSAALVPSPPALRLEAGLWSWGRLKGAFSGWRTNDDAPVSAELTGRFPATASSVFLDSWPCTVNTVSFRLYAYADAVCFAISAAGPASNSPHPADMYLRWSEIEACQVTGPTCTMLVTTSRFGVLSVVPASEPLAWMGNVCCWLWKESRSVTPNVKRELLGYVREPQIAIALQRLFPQCASDLLVCSYIVKLSLHGGPPIQGRLYVSNAHLCFSREDDQSAERSTPNTATTPVAVAAAIMTSPFDGPDEDMERHATPPQARHRSASAVPSPRTPAYGAISAPMLEKASSTGTPSSASSHAHRDHSVVGVFKLKVSLAADVTVVEKDGDDAVVVRGNMGTWTITSAAVSRDVLWNAIRGSVDVASRFNCSPELDYVLVVDDEQPYVEPLVADLAQHSLPAHVFVATFSADRAAALATCGGQVAVVTSRAELLEKFVIKRQCTVVIAGCSADPLHLCDPAALLRELSALKVANLPRTIVVKPLLNESPAAANDLFASARAVETMVGGDVEVCVFRHVPFFQSLFHKGQLLNSCGKLHVPLANASSVVPLFDMMDLVVCVRMVALFRPHALYFPRKMDLCGYAALPLEAVAEVCTSMFDRPVSIVHVPQDVFCRYYAPQAGTKNAAWSAALLNLWDNNTSSSLFQCEVDLVKGSPANVLAQFLEDGKRAILDHACTTAALTAEMSKRWSILCPTGATLCAVDLALSDLGEGVPLLRDAIVKAMRGSNGFVPRDGWLAIMHILAAGPAHAAAEWLFWALVPGDTNKLPRAVFHTIISQMREVWRTSLGVFLLEDWENAVVDGLFRESKDQELSLSEFVEAMRDLVGLVFSVDCLGSFTRTAWPVDAEWSACRVPVIGPGHPDWPTLRVFSIALRTRLAEVEALAPVMMSHSYSSSSAAMAPVVFSLAGVVSGKTTSMSTSGEYGAPPSATAPSPPTILINSTNSSTDVVAVSSANSNSNNSNNNSNNSNSGGLGSNSVSGTSPRSAGGASTTSVNATPSSTPPNLNLSALPTSSSSSATVPPSPSSGQSSLSSLLSSALWTCEEPCPLLFRRVRNVSRVSLDEMLRWLGPLQTMAGLLCGRLGGLQTLFSNSRSGSSFFRSRDGRFLVKTLPPQEDALLQQYMPEYCQYLEQYPDSLLPRFLCLLRLHTPAGLVSFTVMRSVFCGPVSEQYDLKGSRVDRLVGGNADPLIARKDLDLTQTIELGPRQRRRLMGQLERDSAWLQQRNICDYSLLLGFARSDPSQPLPHNQQQQQLQQQQLQQSQHSKTLHQTHHHRDVSGGGSEHCETTFVADDGKVFYMGLIDTLTVYDYRKRGESVLKGFVHDRQEISALNPEAYRTRFLRFIDSITK